MKLIMQPARFPLKIIFRFFNLQLRYKGNYFLAEMIFFMTNISKCLTLFPAQFNSYRE